MTATSTARHLTELHRHLLLTRPGFAVKFAECRLTLEGDRFTMASGVTGIHSIDAASSDLARLAAHWIGFLDNQTPTGPALAETAIGRAMLAHSQELR